MMSPLSSCIVHYVMLLYDLQRCLKIMKGGWLYYILHPDGFEYDTCLGSFVSPRLIFLSSSYVPLLVIAGRIFLFRIFILYVPPFTSIPLHSQCGYPWNYVCVIHESPPGLLTYRYVRGCLSCLYLPQLATPRPGTRVVRLGTCFSSIN